MLVPGCNGASPLSAAVGNGMGADQDSEPWQVSEIELRAAVHDPAAAQVYEADGWRPLWSAAAEAALRRSLDDRARHALDRLAFLPDATASLAPAGREAALTRAALRYAAALAHGAVDPGELHAIYSIPRPGADLAAPLVRAVTEGRLASWFASLAPQDTDYSRLSHAYLEARQKIGSGGQAEIDAGVIRVGDSDSRVPGIVDELVDGEYLAGPVPERVASATSPQPSPDTLYTQRISDAVERLQRDYGIAADGIIGPDTLEVLNLRPGDRARALAVALERLRWLSRSPPPTRIDVNTAAARLSYYRDGKRVDDRRAIVGRPGKETPQLRAPIFRLVANPTWTIPKSIQHGEMAGVGRGYLRRHNMVRRHGWIVQKSGPGNALGLVKFDMRDDYAIYLHDTSARSLFDRSQRHLSHGCVRVEDALGLAQRIAEDEGVADQWQRARGAGDEEFVALPRPIPVRLLYHNVFVDQQGKVAFRTDPYGWNAPIARALGFDRTSNAKARAEAVDIGP